MLFHACPAVMSGSSCLRNLLFLEITMKGIFTTGSTYEVQLLASYDLCITHIPTFAVIMMHILSHTCVV